MKYSFNHAGPYVEIPALDSLLHELRHICKQYHVGFRMVQMPSDYSLISFVADQEFDPDMFTDGLHLYESGVPFLDEARRRWDVAVAKLAEEEAARREAQKQKLEAEAQQRIERAETALREHGITLSDGNYRLVKVTDAAT